jgi:hypothetical protein
MIRHLKSRAPLVALGAALALALPGRGEGVKGVDAATKILPADAAFYMAMLHNREQVEIIGKSKAWAKLWDLPAVKLARKTIEAKLADPDEQTAMVLGMLKQPENRDLVDMLTDAVSDEIFVYGGASWVEFSNLMQQLNTSNQFGSLLARVEGGDNQAEAQARVVLNALAANTKLIRVPEVVVGFKIKNAKKAEAQIKRLETVIEGFSGFLPQSVKDGFKRVKVGESSLLNLTLDGSIVPWDELHIKEYEEKDGQYDALLKKLAALKLSISLGVHKGYLVLAIGESADGLAAMGGSGKRLSERPEFKPLEKYADRRLTSLSYTSKALAAAGQNSTESLRTMLGSLEQMVDAAKLPKAKADKLREDMKWIAAQSKDEHPTEAGASVGFSFLSERGTEGYSYNYGTDSPLDAGKPLTLLEHAGGNPIFFGTLRIKLDHDAKWADKEEKARVMDILKHVEDAVLSKIDDEQKKKYEEVKKDVLPLLHRLYDATVEDLLPSLDGQFGLVVDAQWKSKQWQQSLPAFSDALPGPEVGILIGIADSAKFAKALGRYRALFDDAAKLVHKLSDGDVPDVQVPELKVEEVGDAKLISHPLPAEWGLDKQVAPAGGLSKNVAVLALSRGHAERLLKPTPLKLDGGPLADAAGKPLAAATLVNWPALVDAAGAWIEAGVAMAGLPPTPPGPEGDVLKQVKVVLEVLKCFRGMSSVTYLEDGAMVTHSESVIRDLK